jgi:hypothetical protein
MTRPTVRIGGALQGGGSTYLTAQIPDWIAEGASAAWGIQEESSFYLDDGPNEWDVTYVAMNPRHHDLLSGVHHKQGAASFGTGTHVDARIVGAMSLGMILRSEGVAAAGGIFCYSTGPTVDALWGLGIAAGGQASFFDKRHSGAVGKATLYSTSHGTANVVFATRSSTGVVKVYLDGALIRTTSAAVAPAVLGTEVIAIGGRNLFDHAGLWEEELSAAEVARLTKIVKPWLNI